MLKNLWALAWLHCVHTQPTSKFTLNPSKLYHSLFDDYNKGYLTDQMIQEDITSYLLLRKH